MKPIYFHANKDKRALAEGELHHLVPLPPLAALAAGLTYILMYSVVTAPCSTHSLFPSPASAVKYLTGPTEAEFFFFMTSSEGSHLWEIISAKCAVAWDLGKVK